MNVCELRKIILIGMRFDLGEDGQPLLDGDGLPYKPVDHPVEMRFAFWIPAAAPHQRCAGTTETICARPFELQALKDGAIVEHCQWFKFPKQPDVEEMRRRMMPVWEGLTADALGFLPNDAPLDLKPKFAIQFTAVEAPHG